jgi:hypothetical protein
MLIDGPEGKAFGLFVFADMHAARKRQTKEIAKNLPPRPPIATEIATIRRPEHSKPGEYSTFALECDSRIN